MRQLRITLAGAIILAPLGWLAFGGQPNFCPVPGHGGPPCNMKQCAGMGKDGQPSGNRCSKFCAKQCCLCDEKCPRDSNPGPDEGESK